MQTTQPIMGYKALNPQLVVNWLTETYPRQPPSDFTKKLIASQVKYSKLLGMNPRVPVAQWMQETAEKRPGFTEYVPGYSVPYVDWGNPAGIGITGDPAQDEAARRYRTADAAALAQLAHLLAYAVGPNEAARRFNVFGLGKIQDVDSRWSDYLEKFGTTHTAPTIADLATQWAEDPEYAKGIAGWANRAGLDAMGGGGSPPIEPTERGKVPKPPMNQYHVTASVGQNCDSYANRASQIVGTCHHTSDGYFAGNRSVFSNPAWGGLTDFQVGGPWDGPNDGVIDEFIPATANVAPYANGEVGKATAPYGDGDDFVAEFGVAAVNGRLRSIETTDGAQPDREKGGRQLESLCFLTAYIHSEQAGQSWQQFVWNMHHREFGVPHQGCPGAYIVNHVDTIQARVVAIMRAYQERIPLDMPLLITYPQGWTGGIIPQPGQGEPVPTTPPPPPVTTTPAPVTPLYPPGVDEALASVWFGTVTASGRNFSFNPNGSVSKLWLAHGAETGEYPKVKTYRRFNDGREYWGFEGGLTIGKLGSGQPPKILTATG